ncbi:MAG: hypothetical protein CMQ71_01875 [Gammaproteobacteria bacterium]|nr:hypothetical protein [Gammaproteobacteria bacterium]
MNLKSAHTGKIGKIFRDQRIQRSLSEIEVAERALINIEYIKAIESGDYSIFPARTYALQYFEKYAKFLGLEVKFFDIYSSEVVAQANREDLPEEIFEPFLEKNMIFSSILFVLTFIAVIFLFTSKDNVSESNPMKIQEIEVNILSDDNIDASIITHPEIDGLHTEIDSFLNQDKLDSAEVSANVDRTDPTS